MLKIIKMVFILAMAVMLAVGVCACGRADKETAVQVSGSSDKSVSNSDTVDNAETNILHFVDVFGKPYKTEIRPDIKKHTYDWNYLSGNGLSLKYEDEHYSSRLGIDVSYHQGDIDWKKVKDAGVEFVFLRIGYRGYGEKGNICLDEKFDEYLKEAQDAGLDVGVYFFSQAVNEKEAKEEADFVISHLKGVDLQLPVVYDPEKIRDDKARTDNVTGEQFTKNTIVFCDAVKNAGYEPMLYSNMLWEAFEYDLGQLTDLPIWYADYEPHPQTPYYFSFWQYTEKGTIDGIEGGVDFDLQFLQK